MDSLEFEFNPAKSLANRKKHGIDFIEAQLLWNDERLLEMNATTTEESRQIAIGIVRGKCWLAVFTMRGTAIRLISVRRVRVREVQLYEGQ